MDLRVSHRHLAAQCEGWHDAIAEQTGTSADECGTAAPAGHILWSFRDR